MYLHPWEIFKSCLDAVLGNQLQVAQLEQGRGLDQMTSRGPYQPQPFCDPVTLAHWIQITSPK